MTHLRDAARTLRRRPTEAEKRLWSRLRDRQLEGWKFRRQQPLGAFVVDFLCVEARLVVEVDGGQHAGSTADAARDTALRAQGYEIARYWNHDVLTNLDGVLSNLLMHLTERRAPPPSPRPSPPAGGRGGASRAAGASPRRGAPVAEGPPPLPLAGEGRGEGAPPQAPEPAP